MAVTKTDFELLNQLTGWYPKHNGYLDADEVEKVEIALQINERDILSLRNLRNYTVCSTSRKIDTYREQDKDQMLIEIDKQSALVGVIDTRIWNLGGEV